MTEVTKEIIKLQVGGFRYPVTTWLEGKSRYFQFGFNRTLMEEIKSMDGAKWHGYDDPNPRKLWSVSENQQNEFQLSFLKGENPYAIYDAPLDDVIQSIPKSRMDHRAGVWRALFKHQPVMAAHILVRKQCIIAGEMGTAKTLACMIAMEKAIEPLDFTPECWYVAPRSALAAVQRDWATWGGQVIPEWLTYEGLVKRMKNWQPGQRAPFWITFDESSKLKNITSQRSQAAKAVADGIRTDWGNDGYVTLMTGSPAPKSPADWHSQCLIAKPGFLKEGDIHKFKRRLAVIVMKESFDGGSYPQILSWRNSEKICDKCGKLEDDEIHHPELALDANAHVFKPSVNEVAKLYERLKGLVVVYFKKDCLDLPDKHYRIIECKPAPSTLRAASLIVKGSKTVIGGLTLLRELSDGFQYNEKATGQDVCPLCKGKKTIDQPQEIEGSCPNCNDLLPAHIGQACGKHVPQMQMVPQSCPTCGGIGTITHFDREIIEVPCPKEDALVDLLDEYDDVGRTIIFAGFTGSIDRCVKICQRLKWAVIRMDQGKTSIYDSEGQLITDRDFLSIFQDKKELYPKVAFIAHPKSGGMGLTLTASPVAIYYSNTFDAEDRIQSEDRHHRPGMDLNKGATIIDLIHLPSDLKIMANLKAKRELQSLTLGDFSKILETTNANDSRNV